jgi:hypothetical protein
LLFLHKSELIFHEDDMSRGDDTAT